MGSIAITDQHKILFSVVPNMIGFARETNSPFTSWSRDPFFEGQLSQNAQKSAIDSIANIDDHNMIGFARETNSTFAPW